LVPVELHIVDAEANHANETGERRHDLYKERQMEKVRERIGRARMGRPTRGRRG
jgi:uncharacterized protein (TIGR04552 family)